jgi:hypothetical protein
VVTLARVGAAAYDGKKAKTYQLSLYPESPGVKNYEKLTLLSAWL